MSEARSQKADNRKQTPEVDRERLIHINYQKCEVWDDLKIDINP